MNFHSERKLFFSLQRSDHICEIPYSKDGETHQERTNATLLDLLILIYWAIVVHWFEKGNFVVSYVPFENFQRALIHQGLSQLES